MGGRRFVAEFLGASVLIWVVTYGLHKRGDHTLDTVFLSVGGVVISVWLGYRLYQYASQQSPSSNV